MALHASSSGRASCCGSRQQRGTARISGVGRLLLQAAAQHQGRARAAAGRLRSVRCVASTKAPAAPAAAEDRWLSRQVMPLLDGAAAGPLADVQAACRAALATLRMPSTRNEEYRFTDVSSLLAASLAAAGDSADVAPQLLEAAAIPEAAGSSLVVVDGRMRPELSDLSGLPAGVYVGSADGAPAEALQHLGMQSNVRGGPFAVLNGALARDVLVVALPAGVALLQPLHVLHVSSAAPADAQAAASNGNGSGPLLAASAPRLLVVLGAEASGELIEEHVSAGEGQAGGRHVSVPVAELALGRGACLKHGYVQREADGAAHFKATLVTQDEGSTYELVEARTGGGLSRHDVGVAQAGPDTTTSMRHFLLAGAGQLQDLHSRLVLDHPRGSADQLHKCIAAAPSARGVFDGNVKVNKLAQKTDAGQLSRNLLLVPKATVNVKPNLQIIADDVKCTHGASVCDLSEEELFYFRARGVGYEAARQALVFSFGAEVVQGLRYDALVGRVQAGVVAGLQQALAEAGALAAAAE